ncbi:hypothetical protein ABIA39_009109 [Nocardia sp. GAS34]|uniref:DUF4158 domain-containing protein n=1 Tax=unclassified Nocardia TaxID=2637762 RepID=UPI003D262C7C
MRYDAGKARVIAEEAIRRAVTTKDNPADLINVALEELVRARCELPGFSTLDRLVAAIRAETNTALYAMVAARIDLAAKARLTRLLWLDPTSGRSEFDRLKTPAKAATLGKFKLRLARGPSSNRRKNNGYGNDAAQRRRSAPGPSSAVRSRIACGDGLK